MSRTHRALVLLFLTLGLGCQEEPEFPDLVGFKMPEPPIMTEHEGPGFRYSLPPGWVSETKGAAAVAKPAKPGAKAVMTMQLTAYGTGETAETIVEAAHETRSKYKKSYEHIKTMVAGFPTFRQLYRKDGKPNLRPDQVYHLIGTPLGKVTITTEFENGTDLVEYRVDVETIAESIKF